MSKPNRFKIDKKNNVVVDLQNCLMWQRDIRYATWEEADETAKSSHSSGFSDWRLPTIEELQTLLEGIPEVRTEGEFLKGKGEYGFYWSRGLWNLEEKYHSETKEVDDYKKAPASVAMPVSAQYDTSKSGKSEPNNGMWLDDNLEKKIWTDSFFWSSSDYDEWKEKQKSKDNDIDKTEPENPANSGSIDNKEIKLTVSKTEFKAGIFFSSGKIGCRCKDSEIPKYYFCVRKFEKPKPEAERPIELGIVEKQVSHKAPDSGSKPPSSHVSVSKPQKRNSFVLPAAVTACLVTVVFFVIFFFRYREESDPALNQPVPNKNIVKSDNSIELVPKPDDGEKATQNSPLPQKETIPAERRTKCGRSFRNSGLTWCRATGRPTDWGQANEYCRNIWDDGKTGWRLPTLEEFEMLKQDGDIDRYFLDRQQRFWRSDGKSLYWNRLEEYGEDHSENKKIKKADFLCVRKNR